MKPIILNPAPTMVLVYGYHNPTTQIADNPAIRLPLIKCSSKLCNSGKEVQTFTNCRPMKNQEGRVVPVPFMDKRLVTCGTCKGSGKNRCWCCSGGIQK